MTKSTFTLSERDNINAAEYALGVMQGEARVQFAKRMAEDATLAAAVRHWDEHFVDFSNDIAAVEPPRHIAAALEKTLFAGTAQQSSSWWDSLGFWRGLAGAALVAVIALSTWTLLPPTQQAIDGALVAQVAAAQGDFKLVAYYDEGKGELRLNRVGGVAASGRSLELWLIAGQDAPVSLGVLPDATTTRVNVPESLRAKFKNGVLAVSDEPIGGSPTGVPTGAVLATGPLTAV